jgi:hypothetical protein
MSKLEQRRAEISVLSFLFIHARFWHKINAHPRLTANNSIGVFFYKQANWDDADASCRSNVAFISRCSLLVGNK